jgi:hypothetical protein
MSADGPGLFDDDTAHDVREQFTRMFAETRDAAAATKGLIAAWQDSLKQSDEGPVFWLALAATQWRYGCLQPQVLKGAIEVIESGSDLARWRGSPHEQRRVSTLKRLSQQLSRSQPVPRVPKLRKERVPPRSIATSPDGYCEAQSVHFGTRIAPRSNVYILAATDGGGPVVLDVECDYQKLRLQWLSPTTLEIAYPSDARLVRKQDSAVIGDREIAVVVHRY